MADVVGTGDLHQCLTSFPSCNGLPLLVWGKFGISSKLNPPRYRPRAPFPSPRSNQFTLELGKTTKYSQHQSAMRCRGVGPSIPKRPKTSSSVSNGRKDVQ